MTQVNNFLTSKRMPRFRLATQFGWLEAVFLLLTAAALGLRLWELDGRAMHYDEAIHLHFSWKLAQGTEYIHSPWMHGPFQIELVALLIRFLGDTDFVARLCYPLFGTALVALPYFLRDHIGKAGAVITAVMLTLSPTLLYFSRFGRNDILMAFWVTFLFILMWRYIHESKNRYLYFAASILALMFATKETAYIVTLVFGALLFLLALPNLVPWAFGRIRLSQLNGAAGFLLLLLTLTLPQWVALAGLFQGVLGLTLVSPVGVSQGIVGTPEWSTPYVLLPLYDAPWLFHAIIGVLLTIILWLANPLDSSGPDTPTTGSMSSFLAKVCGVIAPAAVAAAVFMALFRPWSSTSFGAATLAADVMIATALAGAAVVVVVSARRDLRRRVMVLLLPAVIAVVYLTCFTGLVDVDAAARTVLPSGLPVDTGSNVLPVAVLAAGGLLVVALAVSIYVGVRWLGKAWLVCGVIFYGVWATLYTTMFSNFAGLFSGAWQGMGYWIAQQPFARGNQPWYYYFVGLSVYELLPVIFGLIAFVYFLKKGDVMGLALSFWAGVTLLGYTIASEKMPWLLVNITLPFILLSGMFLGEMVERAGRFLLQRTERPVGAGLVPAQGAHKRRPYARSAVKVGGMVALLLLPPLVVVAAVYLLLGYVNGDNGLSPVPSLFQGIVLFLVAAAALAVAWLVRLARPSTGLALTAMGLAGLLLVFGTVAAFRAAYTYDDSSVEILVYAQGSSDLPKTFRELDRQVFEGGQGDGNPVLVDYDMWYPFQWYVRHPHDEGILQFQCFKAEGEDGWNSSCSPVSEEQASRTLLLKANHGGEDVESKVENEKEGPFRDLLWFPESYRRPHENRQAEGSQWGIRGLPSATQLSEDFNYFGKVAASRESWADGINYLVFRDLEADWFISEYYSFLP